MKSKSSIGIIIESTVEDFIKAMKNKTYSEMNMTKKALEMEFSRSTTVKDSLIELMKSQNEDEAKKTQQVINDVYIILQRIEDKAVVLNELMEELRTF